MKRAVAFNHRLLQPRLKLVAALIAATLVLATAPALASTISATVHGTAVNLRSSTAGANPLFNALGTARSSLAPTAARSGWSITPTPNPTAPTGQLMFGTCTSASSCTAVGTYVKRSKLPVTLAERWNGSRWRVQPTPNPAGARVSVLNGVACSAPSACMAVGNTVAGSGKATTLVERWNGRRWRIEPTPNPAASSQSVLFGVACPLRSACLAVGASNPFTPNSKILVERWNGSRWHLQSAPGPAGALLHDVSCTAPSTCTAVGGSNGGTLAERWNGRIWRIESTPNPPQGGGFLSGVACTVSSSCTAVGGSNAGTLAERWNGTKWRIQSTPNPSGSQGPFLNGVDCSSRSACTAVGGYGNASGGFFTVAERWNGHRWTIQRTPSPGGGQGDVLLAVACPSSSACTAFGSSHGSGTPLTMAQRWNGTGWRLQGTRNPVGAAETQLNGVACPSTSSCFAVGTAGPTLGIRSAVAQHWNGSSWQNLPIPTVPGVSLNAVSCASLSACFAVGQSDSGVLAERWNGNRWRIQHIPSPAGAHGAGLGAISCTSTSFCMAAGAFFSTSNQSGPAKAFTERWNGTRWSILPTPNPAGSVQTFPNGVSCTSASACTVVGEQHFKTGVVHTVAERWNATRWMVQPTPNPPKAPGASLAGVACTSPTACIAAGLAFDSFGNPAGTLAERWNGTSWTIQPTPSPSGAVGLSGVACPAPASCTAVGLASTNLGGMVLAEHWNGDKWHIQPTPLIPAVSVGTSSPPAVACPSLTACTAVGGYEAPGPTSVTLAEQWNAGRGTAQRVAGPSRTAKQGLSCARPLALRAELGRKPPAGPALGPSGRWWMTKLNSCRSSHEANTTGLTSHRDESAAPTVMRKWAMRSQSKTQFKGTP